MKSANKTTIVVDANGTATVFAKEADMKARIEAATADALYDAAFLFNKCKEAIAESVPKEGETKESFTKRVEGLIDSLLVGLNKALTMMADATGLTSLRLTIYDMMDAGLAGKTKGKRDLYLMVDKYRDLVNKEIAYLNKIGTEKSLKKALTLKAYTQDGEGKNIFEAVIGSIILIGNKVSAKLKKWFKIDVEGSIMNTLCKKFSSVGSVLRKGGKFVFNAVNLAVGYVIAGSIKVVEIVSNCFVAIFNNIKEWVTEKRTKAVDGDAVTMISEEIAVCESSLNECEADNRKARIAEIKAEIARLEAKKARLS